MAPKRLAASSFPGTRSTAMMVRAPDRAAPWMLFRPTPPAPMTTAVSPGRSRAVLVTAPSPVITPQARRAALSNGTSFAIATACEAWTTTLCAKAAVLTPCVTGCPERSLSGERASSGSRVSQVTGMPPAQDGQCPQERISVTTT